MPTALFGVLVTAALTAAACSSGDDDATPATVETTVVDTTEPSTDPSTTTTEVADPTTTVADDPAFVPAEIVWDALDDNVELGLLDVPVDYGDPAGPTFELFLARHAALDPDARIGSLLVNPGGPGFGGSDFAIFAPQIFDAALLERFDIIGWDPRGTGESDPAIDCIDDYDPYFTAIDSTPATDAERDELLAIAQDFAAQCIDGNADIIEYVGTNNSARDMDAIRASLGEDTISYFGFSYGSELGATWATLFPDTVRAAVLDGAADPEADSLESSLQQLRGFDSTLATFLAQCSADDACDFHNDGDAEGAFDALLVELDENPLEVDADRPPVNRDVAILATIRAMYSQFYWPSLERSLEDAQNGDGAGLLQLHDAYYERNPDGTYGNELEAFQTISCADTPERPTIEELDAETDQYREASPRLVPEGSVGTPFCSYFPTAIDPRVDITGAGAGPIVVIGTTGDPATPLESSQAMADALEGGVLVVVEADEHTGYGLNRCIVDVVNDYLVELVAPDPGTVCS